MNIRNLLFICILLILCTISSPKATNGSIIKLDDTSEDIKEHINDFMTQSEKLLIQSKRNSNIKNKNDKQSVINVDIDLDVDYTELDFENDNTKNKNEINEEISTDIEYETYGPENELDVETDNITCYDEENEIDNSYNKINKQNKGEISISPMDTKQIIGWIFIGIFLVCCLIFSCYKHMKKIVITYVILVVFGYSLLTIVFLIEGVFWGSSFRINRMPLWEKIIFYIGCFLMGILIVIPAFILVCCKIICCLFSDDWRTPDVYEIHEINEYGHEYNVRYEDWNGNELPHPHNSCILQ